MVMLAVFAFTFVSCGDDDKDDPAPAAQEYTIKYDANGGTGTIASTTYKAGEKVTLSDGGGLSRDGYTFSGWSDKADGSALDVNAIMNKNVTLYAVWKKIEVNPDPNSGETTDVNAFFPEGFDSQKVVAWYYAPATGNQNEKSEAVYLFNDGTYLVTNIKVKDGKEIKQIAAKGVYQIKSNDYKNGTVQAVVGNSTYEVEVKDGVLNSPSADGTGYTYTWQDNGKIPAAQKADEDNSDKTDLVGTEYTIKFDPNGGTGSIPDLKVKVGENPALPTGEGFTRDGYTLDGWSTSPDGTEIDESVFATSTEITFYAVWKKNEEPVDFTMIVRVNGVNGNKVSVTGYIDGFAGRNDIDLSKITVAGFAIEPLSANKIPDNTSTMVMAQVGKDGGFSADIEITETGVYVINAFVLYDNNPKVSDVESFTIIDDNNNPLPVDIDLKARVNSINGKTVELFGYIDGLAGRTDIDVTKISRYGFYVVSDGGDLTTEEKAQVDEKSGGFVARVEKEAGEYAFVVFIVYDGDEIKSESVAFTIESGNEGGNEGGNVLPETLPAFFPSDYDKANVVAWYSVTLKDAEEIRTESVFLFSDKSVVVSKNQIKADGRITRSFTFDIEVMPDVMPGVRLPLQYELTEGSTYENGIANVGVSLRPDAQQAFIQNGVLTIPAFAADTQYTLQNLADIPDASDPTK